MQKNQYRTIAHELVRNLPPDLIHNLAALERQGILEEILKRSVSRVLLNRVVAGSMAGHPNGSPSSPENNGPFTATDKSRSSDQWKRRP